MSIERDFIHCASPAKPQLVGRDFIVCSTELLEPMKAGFIRARYHANRRGVEFKMTFDQWASAWLEREKWFKRGKRADEYVMGRFNDEGPYEVGNIEIITFAQNVQDGNRGRVQTEEHKKRKNAAQVATRAAWSDEEREKRSKLNTAGQVARWAKVSLEKRQEQHQKMRVGYDAAKVKPK